MRWADGQFVDRASVSFIIIFADRSPCLRLLWYVLGRLSISCSNVPVQSYEGCLKCIVVTMCPAMA